MSMLELTMEIRDVSESDARFVWIDGKFLLDQEVGQWMELPLWIEDESDKGLHRADISRALATGLTYRPLADTVQATLDLAATTDSSVQASRNAAWYG